MRRTLLLLATTLTLLGIVVLSGVALDADPVKLDRKVSVDPTVLKPQPERFRPCPSPSCMAPCQFPPEPQVVCREPNGAQSVTSFFCCCCGGSNGVSYRPL